MVSGILALNGLIYLLWQIPSERWLAWMMRNFLVSGEGVLAGYLWTLITAEFSHFAFLHLFVNMIVLMGFGRVLELKLGAARFLRFYLAAGAVSSFSHVLVSSFLLDQPELPALGASGAISAVVLLFALIYPRERILLFGLLPLPALWGALIAVGIDLLGLASQARGSSLPIGYGAHLGGASFGLAYYFFIFAGPGRNAERSSPVGQRE